LFDREIAEKIFEGTMDQTFNARSKYVLKKPRERLKERYPVEYSWATQARNRCRNPNCKAYPAYGGRGIEFRFATIVRAVRWVVANLGPRPTPRHTIDRIKNDGHYECGNLRWATWREQHRNRRNNVILSQGHAEFIRGLEALSYNTKAIAASQGVSYEVVYAILQNRSWLPDEDVLNY
jgi:hypothetical protein